MNSDVQRLALILEPLAADGLADALAAAVTGLAGHIGVRIATPGAVDMFALAEDRARPRPVGAAVELTCRSTDADATLFDAARQVAAGLAGRIDAARSTVAIGPLHVIEQRAGDALMVIAARRDPSLTAAAFFDWWYNQHAPLARRLLGGTIPFGYEQVHVDQARSRTACGHVGFGWEPLDVYETLVAPSFQTFIDIYADQAFQQGLVEDEAGHIDHASLWAGGMDGCAVAMERG